MSPLARSLLALAALLAAADAQNDCITFTIGQVTSDTIKIPRVDLNYGINNLNDNDHCTPPMHQVGATFTVCNKNPGYPRPYHWDNVKVYCHDPSGCTADIVEYCGY